MVRSCYAAGLPASTELCCTWHLAMIKVQKAIQFLQLSLHVPAYFGSPKEEGGKEISAVSDSIPDCVAGSREQLCI